MILFNFMDTIKSSIMKLKVFVILFLASLVIGSCKKKDEDTSGCTNTDAVNFNEEATIDDGSCIIRGCTDPSADNYNEYVDGIFEIEIVNANEITIMQMPMKMMVLALMPEKNLLVTGMFQMIVAHYYSHYKIPKPSTWMKQPLIRSPYPLCFLCLEVILWQQFRETILLLPARLSDFQLPLVEKEPLMLLKMP